MKPTKQTSGLSSPFGCSPYNLVNPLHKSFSLLVYSFSLALRIRLPPVPCVSRTLPSDTAAECRHRDNPLEVFSKNAKTHDNISSVYFGTQDVRSGALLCSKAASIHIAFSDVGLETLFLLTAMTLKGS